MFDVVEKLWQLRYSSPEAALLHAKARSANIKPVADEHSAILRALTAQDPVAARAAMRAHLAAVLESLLYATEEIAVEEARSLRSGDGLIPQKAAILGLSMRDGSDWRTGDGTQHYQGEER